MGKRDTFSCDNFIIFFLEMFSFIQFPFTFILEKPNDTKVSSPTKSKLTRGRPVRGHLVHSMTFTAKDVDPTSRFLTGREAVSRNEAKRREAVWDLFQSETAFLLDHLMVLKHVSTMLLLLFM